MTGHHADLRQLQLALKAAAAGLLARNLVGENLNRVSRAAGSRSVERQRVGIGRRRLARWNLLRR